MSDDPNAPPVESDPEDADTAALAVNDAAGNRMVPLSALISAKRENKTLHARNKELEPIAARVTEIDGKLQTAQPILDAIMTDPKLRATVQRIAAGTRATAGTVEQPDDDPDAAALAEDSGYYLQDGQLDVARAQRIMQRLDARTARQTAEAIRPLAGVTLQGKADQHFREALAATDANGVPWASQESITKAWAMLPAHLLANPQVVELAVNNAIGMDRREGRTPTAATPPLFLESAGSRTPREPAISAKTKASLERLGLTEKEFQQSNQLVEEGRQTGRIPLGVK